MVDEAKAFCPGCGHAFVSERQRGEMSEYEAKGHTVQLGQTMYNKMLSDMGLNISKAPDPVEKKVEPIASAVQQVLTPVGDATRNAVSTKKRTNKWLIAAITTGILLLLGVILLIAAAVVIFYFKLV